MRLVVALGGNALGETPKQQQANIKIAVHEMIKVLREHEVIITHGNGPQVGIIDLAFVDSYENKAIPYMPLAESGAMSQGYIGYHIVKCLKEEYKAHRISKKTAALITQVTVDENDPGFSKPTKPIGLFYTKNMAEIASKKYQERFIDDAGRGYRKVVASPKPKQILELETIKLLIENNHTVVCCGGGGIPVSSQDNNKGLKAVIDKDLASSLLAKETDADGLIILTTVDQVSLDYNTKNEQKITRMSVREAKQYMLAGQFAEGSMLPKVEACVNFVKGTNKKAYITSINNIGNLALATLVYDDKYE